MKKTAVLGFSFLFLCAQMLLGVNPEKWDLQRKEDFLKGKFDGVSVSSEGVLSLSPREENIEGPAEEFYLSLLVASDGSVFLGTGHGGNIYKFNKDNTFELYFKVPEMDIYCLAMDKRGDLYAGTSPNGKVYKITAKGKGSTFFNPQEKYIWDLQFTEQDSLLAAVGESGGIYEINTQGEGRLILKAEENHILCLELTESKNLIAGSGGKGLIYKITPGRKSSILFESPFEEIKSIALDKNGNIYAAAGGTVIQPKRDLPLVDIRPSTEITVTATPAPAQTRQVSPPVKKQPSALYRIDPEGIAKKLWESNQDLIYSLSLDEDRNKVIFGTGNNGRIYEVDRDANDSLLLQKKSEQVYLLIPSRSMIYALSNNPSRIDLLFPDQRLSGEYTSHVLDTKTMSTWGRIEWDVNLPAGTSLQFQTRSGNSVEPDQTWSEWSPPIQKAVGEGILSPRARHLQFKAIFKAGSGKGSPILNEVTLFYLPTNHPPIMGNLELLPANIVYLKPPEQGEVIWGAEEDLSILAQKKNENKDFMAPKKVQRKGFRTVLWSASDDNGDNLVYSIFIRGKDEREWRTLKKESVDKVFAFDTFSFPDGTYYIKVIASDSPSNSQGAALESEKVSRPLVIDNSSPAIRDFRAIKDKNRLSVTFTAEDLMSYIKEVKYLVRPGEWQTVFPDDGICDSKQESFSFRVPLTSESDNLIAVKVRDSHDNIGVHRATF
jgi:hypothetical protein